MRPRSTAFCCETDGKPRLVLVVHDEEMIRRLVRAVLEADAFEVADARGTESSLCLASETRPAAVVLECKTAGADAFLTNPFSSIWSPR